MIHIDGMIRTTHANAPCVAKAICVDNLESMETAASETVVTTTIGGTRLRSVIASVDDYLMNLGIAEEACLRDKDPAGFPHNNCKNNGKRTERTR